MRSIAEIVNGMMKRHEKAQRKRPEGRRTLPNPGWKRQRRKERRNEARNRRWELAADPVPMTRQVARQKSRRLDKMPLGMRQADWHRHLGLAVSRKMEARAGNVR